MRRPRDTVLDEVWRGLDGVAALSGAQGGPLRRTVKLILDPLVLRPVQNPLCAGPILTAEGVAEVTARLRAAAPVLRATAEWFTLLKQVRRTLRITDGNPQDLYFQRCFELASTGGAPDRLRGKRIAEATLSELHGFTAGRTTRALREYLTEPARTRELTGAVQVAWQRRPLVETEYPDRTGEFIEMLDACAAARGRSARSGAGAAHARLLSDHAGTHSGIRLWFAETSPGAQYLGLTEHPAPPPPPLGSTASTATLARPFDRSIYERVFTVLQAALDRADLPTVPDLVGAEIARSCAPWALLDESLRLAAAAGVALALGLRPLGDDPSGESVARQVINGRWRREAYVLQARRLAVRPEDDPGGPLAAVAADLRTPWQPYLRRLWVRLHGRDVRELPLSETGEFWDVLDGVARSVMLDHRMRVKQALSADLAGAQDDSTESRAS
ncbi:hypothetical protein [Nocardia macrotermitis]|uniref:Uncharacterized protein n=1 Tax=Nocardia macrotermitis TaxID=2585198 RepID=A0A7K0D437_9NOCA|nr:hypothetical protein [Nocardia macrotermitis]MQY20496.1 hypothetical protein [Nocardia macrotermitis]